jgi:hypothetical protein
MNRYGRLLGLGLVVILTGCGSGDAANPTAAKTTNEPTSTAAPRDITGIPDFAPLEPGTYFIDPDDDSSTPLRVVYRIAADGWSMWIGAAKFTEDGHVGVSIATVTNLVRHGCRDHSRPDPPVGPTVDDLAAALADLAPFRVTAPPTDITIYGYRGKHLELTVPKIDFAECIGGKLKSWIAPPYGAFYGYTGPGHIEEFWILDVEGSRLVIAADRSPGSPAKDIAEMRAILDSIQIEP